MSEPTPSYPLVHLAEFEPIETDVLSVLPPTLIKKQMIVPIKKEGGRITMAVSTLEGVIRPEGLSLITGFPVDLVLAPADEISSFIKNHYTDEDEIRVGSVVNVSGNNLTIITPTYESSGGFPFEEASDIDFSVIEPELEASDELVPDEADLNPETVGLYDFEPAKKAEEKVKDKVTFNLPVTSQPQTRSQEETLRRVEIRGSLPSELLRLLSLAVTNRATEIVINLMGKKATLRQRIRGVMVPVEAGHSASHEEIKKLFEWVFKEGDRKVTEWVAWAEVRKEIPLEDKDYFCHMLLTETGRTNLLTLRINSHKDNVFSPQTWGMDATQTKLFSDMLQKSQGVILFAGTDQDNLSENLYGCVKQLASPSKHVMAVSSFMESWVSGVEHFISQGNPSVFTELLKLACQHAPDVLLVNPLERKDQYEISLTEALKGRLILGRSFAHDGLDGLIQLVSMGVEPYIVGSVLLGVVSKRTLRLNCQVCLTKDPDGKALAKDMGIPESLQPTAFYFGKGCESCSQTGFMGETNIFEVLSMTNELRNIFRWDVSVEKIRNSIKSSNFSTLRQNALHKALNGQTSLAEVLRVTSK